MSKYKNFPGTVINNYVADFLDAEDIMKKVVPINGLQQPTIIPAAQIPELNDSGPFNGQRQTPFMVYSYEVHDDDEKEWSECELMNYIIFAPTVAKVQEILYALRDLFGRTYSSADEIRDWQVSKLAQGEDIYFDFLSTEWKLLEGPSATRTEGGRFGALFSVHYEYTYPVQTKLNGQVGRRI